jgi:valyl-tRNA synthetase
MMEARYDPHALEQRWQRRWEEEGLYAAGAGARLAETFVICVPPPNVTGDLHMGHALNGSMQDCLIRWHRMRGFDTLWQPGYDHAGIATQNVVEKQLLAEGSSRQQIGRLAFLDRTWAWLEATGRTIMGQFRQLGCSLDYARERFTMDEGYVEAVMTAFVALWDAGFIYRAHRIVNWCPYHQTALSDLEVEHVEADDELVYVRYPFVDGSGAITIATVRPATILADVAVAVHPDDPRYAGVVGKEVVVPVVGRIVPVIADPRVEPDFGSGALKITPGHDAKDFEIGRAHGLETLSVIGADGAITAEGFEGLSQAETARLIIAWLEEHDQLAQREPIRHAVATCERCHTRIEPIVSPQWWCAMDELAAPALAALRAGSVRFHPEGQHRFAIDSLENAPDWCVSRQLWWGHQIPIWTCPDGHRICTWPPPEACRECGAAPLERETDVLDTWFSSALWPFATLGWPHQTAELARYYPGNVNVTAREIIRLWENRMIFSGLFLLGEIPFTDVIITSTVLAADGRRMSKSLGTGIDPLEAVGLHGADATRYGLLKISSTQDVRFSWGAIEEGAKLARKLWNVSRLILGNAAGVEPALAPVALEERWIVGRIDETRAELEQLLPRFDFAHAAEALYHLTFDDFCDWFAEAIKPRLHARERGAVATSLAALERLLALLHPIQPHVTEEIWAQFHDSRLILGPWPDPAARDPQAAEAMGRVQAAAALFRRSGVLLPPQGEDEQRVFDAVVRPGRTPVQAGAAIEAERERLGREIARSEAMLANDAFVRRAPPELVEAERGKLARYRSELDALGA